MFSINWHVQGTIRISTFFPGNGGQVTLRDNTGDILTIFAGDQWINLARALPLDSDVYCLVGAKQKLSGIEEVTTYLKGRSPQRIVNADLQDLRLAAKALGYTLTPINPDPQAEHEAARIAENEPEVFNDPRNEEEA